MMRATTSHHGRQPRLPRAAQRVLCLVPSLAMLLGWSCSGTDGVTPTSVAQRPASHASGPQVTGGLKTVDGIPIPAKSDRVILDLRQSLQQVTTIDAAFALFPGGDHTAARDAGRNDNGWSFSANYDGAGTHALRADWAADATGDDGIRIISHLPTPKPKEIFIQWKSRHGAHPADWCGGTCANAPNGFVNRFPIFPESESCKRMLVLRDVPSMDADHRIDYTWTRDEPTTARMQMNGENFAIAANPSAWKVADWIAKPYTTTVYIKAASSKNAHNALFRMWMNDQLVIDYKDDQGVIQDMAFDRWQFPDTCHNMPIPASEYFWDILVWLPR